ncbi:hypothetical protein BGX26_007096 [Mortierella sp. AD094]|nr:hypothetical protein BGX26_007096 [Mortierella sp. AD094]
MDMVMVHLPQRPNQFSDWTNVKERERARLLSNVARARSTQPPIPSSEAAKENLRRLSQRIHQRRTRARETILYDLHQGVKTVEAQVQKQVDIVLSKLKDAPGSKYAFALTHTFLTQLPQALSNTILPSAISAVADTVAGRTTNSLTTLRGRAGLDEFDEEEEDDEDEDDEMDDLDDLEELGYQQQVALMRLHQQQDSQLSSDFRTIALASPPLSPSDTHGWSSSSMEGGSCSYSTTGTGTVSISSAGASEFLAASTHHNYSSAASQVLNAALPSFIPSMVAPIVCVFSYPSPSTSKPNSPNQSSTSVPTLLASIKGKGVAQRQHHHHQQQQQQQEQEQEQEDYDGVRIKQEEQDFDLQAAIKADPGVAAVTSTAWTSAEREALFLAATRFRLRGQWAKIRQTMCLHHTDKEIENEYQRLYGESADEDEDSDIESENGNVDRNQVMQQQQQQVVDDNLVLVKIESDVEDDGDADADDEAEATVFMRFGDHQRDSSTSCTPAISSFSPIPQEVAEPFRVQESVPYLMDIQSLPTGPEYTRRSTSRHSDGHHHHHHHRHNNNNNNSNNKRLLNPLNEKPLQVIKKEFMVDKRFKLEEIPMHL